MRSDGLTEEGHIPITPQLHRGGGLKIVIGYGLIDVYIQVNNCSVMSGCFLSVFQHYSVRIFKCPVQG